MVFREIVFGTAEYRLERDLRHAVLREPLGLSFTAEELANEDKQLHFGLFEPEDNLIACVVAVRLSPTDARIRQMAVTPAHQRRGLGTRLMKELEEHLRSRGFTNLVLHARASAVEFYEKLGFRCVGAVFDEAGIPHRKMILKKTRKRPQRTQRTQKM